jgi:hypothetical protein
MKGALIGLCIAIALLVILLLDLKIHRSHGTIDIHFYDTTLVTSYTFVVVFVLLFSGSFFAIGGIIATFFKSKGFWILAVLFVVIDTYYILTVYKALNNNNTAQLPKR